MGPVWVSVWTQNFGCCGSVRGLSSQGKASGTAGDENVLPDFVSARIEDLCVRIPRLMAQRLLNTFFQVSVGKSQKSTPNLLVLTNAS